MASTTLSAAPLLRWDGAEGFTRQDDRGHPAVADSWLVRDGRARGLDLHWSRFGRACAEHGFDDDVLARFRAAVLARLPRTGAWFPRVEVGREREPRLALRLRHAPVPSVCARLWVADVPDPRRRPARKGPDFESQEALRRRAGSHGADEAVLTDPGGVVREGAFSSLQWWDGGVLCTAPQDGAVLPGVTRSLVLRHCALLGIPVRYERVPASRPAARESWILSALHGIRVVTHWDGRPAPAADAARVLAFRSHLASLMLPLPPLQSPASPRPKETR